MYGSLKICTLFGIPIRLHWSFFLLGWVFFLEPLTLPVIFGSVLLHELGHSLMARRFGIHVVDITFWPLGGMARMSNIPEQPKVEGLVAIAGPLVNLVLAGLAIIVLLVSAVFHGTQPSLWWTLGTGSFYFAGINLLLGTFNLVPAFPMDGGRILRAILARRVDWVRATEYAVRVGRYVAASLVALSIVASLVFRPLAQMSCFMTFIAVYLYFGGTRELMAVRIRHGQPIFGTPRTGATGRARDASPAWAPSTASPPSTPSGSTEPGRARRPVVWDQAPPAEGFDEDRVRELEQFPGRLRRQRDEE